MRREILASRTPETLTRSRYEHKLLLGEAEALALEIALADRLALKLFPCGDATRIVTIYLDRRDGLLARHALEDRGAHLRVRVKGFFPAEPPFDEEGGEVPWGTNRSAAGRVPRAAGANAPAERIARELGADPAAALSSAASPGLALEVKRRRAGLTRKERIWCRPAELPVLLAGADDARCRRLRLDRIAPGVRPLCMVGYVRRVYEDPAATLRVTVDRRLGRAVAGAAELALLATGVPPEVPATPDAPVVAEIKHLGPLPGWIADTVERAEARFSKLVWALRGVVER